LLYSRAVRSALPGAVPRPLLILVASFVVVHALLMLRPDWPVSAGDTPRILHEAGNLAHGRPMGPTGTAFFLPHAILAALSSAGLGLRAYVVIQILLAGAAMLALYALVKSVVGGDITAALAAGAWALNPLVQQWNYFVLSDGLYQSLAILATVALVRAIDRPSRPTIAAAAIALAAVSVCRPHGQLWPLIAMFTMFARRPKSAATGAATAVLVAAEAGLLTINRPYAEFMDMVQHFANGQVIWGYSAYTLAMPAWQGPAGGGLRSVVEYGLAHPFAAAQLALARIVVEASAMRPFYSTFHNAACVVFYWPLYALGATGLWLTPASTLKTVSLMSVAAHFALVGLTHADSDGRWFLQVLPYLLIWGTIGAVVPIEARVIRARA
jgi:hypothetical protein